MRRRFLEIVETFRRAGATTPEKAMTAQELGLPPRFQEAMHRRLGQSGIIVEVNGKYYLSEERLRQIQAQRQGTGSALGPRTNMMTLKILRMITTVVFVATIIINFFIQSWALRIFTVIAGVAWIAITIAQIYYLSRVRRRMSTYPPHQQT